MAGKDLKDLLVHPLKDTLYAENAILKALRQLAEVARSEEPNGALAVHLKETKGQMELLKRVFKLLGEKPESVECAAIKGVIYEGEEMMDEFGRGEASLDAGLIASAQRESIMRSFAVARCSPGRGSLALTRLQSFSRKPLIEKYGRDPLGAGRGHDQCQGGVRSIGGPALGRPLARPVIECK